MSKKLTTKQFIEKARKVHGDKYDYSKVKYVDFNTKVCIICPIHGEFLQLPGNHFQGKGCPKCGCNIISKKLSMNTEEFIRKAKKVHANKYDYSKVEYVNSSSKVCIICPIHGEFLQETNSHLCGHGCPKCKSDEIIKRQTMTNESFIQKAKKIHGNKYDYSKVKYIGINEKICIVCPIHGEFYQKPNDHLNRCGCPKCNQSKLENEIELFLKERKIEFNQFKRFDWLDLQHLDFYLPEYNIAIECQGIQHYEPINYFGGKKEFEITRKRDDRKKNLCKENGIELLYFTHYANVKEENSTFKTKEKLLSKIKSKKIQE